MAKIKKNFKRFWYPPEAIKMAPLVKALEADERFESKVCNWPAQGNAGSSIGNI